MRRRDFLILLAGAMGGRPSAVWAQQKAMPVIGFTSIGSAGPYASIVAAFHQGLSETGYVEGPNVAIEYHWAEGDYDRLPALFADQVARKVDAIFAGGGSKGALAAKRASSTIPIVFVQGGDPVELGLVASLARPGGNLTGGQHPSRRADAQAARATIRAGAAGRHDCPTCEPKQCECRAHRARHAGSGGTRRGCSSTS